MDIRRMHKIRRENRRGAVLVEAALVLPLFFMVVLGVIEFGRGMMVSQMITNAAREGSRLGMLDGKTNTDVETFVRQLMVDSTGVATDDVTVTITVTPAPGNSDPGDQLSAAQAQDLVEVRVQVPFDKVSYVTGKYLAGKNLVGISAMRHE